MHKNQSRTLMSKVNKLLINESGSVDGRVMCLWFFQYWVHHILQSLTIRNGPIRSKVSTDGKLRNVVYRIVLYIDDIVMQNCKNSNSFIVLNDKN